MGIDLLRSGSAGTALVAIAPDERGRILLANQALAAILASEVDEVTGTFLWDHIDAPDREAAGAAFTRLCANPGGAYEGRWRLRAADGALCTVGVWASLIPTGTGTAVLLRMAVAAV